MMVKRQDTKQFLWYLVKAKKCQMLLLFFFQVFLGISGVFIAVMLRKVIDTAVAENARGFWWAIGLFVVLIVAQLLARILLRYLEEATKADLEIYLKEILIKSLLN